MDLLAVNKIVAFSMPSKSGKLTLKFSISTRFNQESRQKESKYLLNGKEIDELCYSKARIYFVTEVLPMLRKH